MCEQTPPNLPESNPEEQTLIYFQCNSKLNRNGKPVGFMMIDEHILRTINHYVHLKIERIRAWEEAKIKEEQVVATIQLTSDIVSNSDSYLSLFKEFKA